MRMRQGKEEPGLHRRSISKGGKPSKKADVDAAEMSRGGGGGALSSSGGKARGEGL